MMVMLHKSLVLLEGEWPCYVGGHFQGLNIVILPRWSVVEREWS